MTNSTATRSAEQTRDLDDVTLLDSLDARQRDLLLTHSTIRHFEKGEWLLTEGETAREVFVLLDGIVRIFRSDDAGRELTLNLLTTGDCFGELGLLANRPRTASAIAVTPCRVRRIGQTAFMQCVADNRDFQSAVMHRLVAYVSDLTDEAHTLAVGTVYERLIRVLNKLARDDDKGRRIVAGFSHRQLADMCGASREMVSKLLADLRTGGYIATDARIIVLNKTLPSNW